MQEQQSTKRDRTYDLDDLNKVIHRLYLALSFYNEEEDCFVAHTSPTSKTKPHGDLTLLRGNLKVVVRSRWERTSGSVPFIFVQVGRRGTYWNPAFLATSGMFVPEGSDQTQWYLPERGTQEERITFLVDELKWRIMTCAMTLQSGLRGTLRRCDTCTTQLTCLGSKFVL